MKTDVRSAPRYTWRVEETTMTTTKSITTPATEGQEDAMLGLVQLVGKRALKGLGLDRDKAQRLLGSGGKFNRALLRSMRELMRRYAADPNIVSVPDVPAVELTALARRGVWVGDEKLSLTQVDGDYAAWDFYRRVDQSVIHGRGKQFRVMVWKPELEKGATISSEAVRAHFQQLGFYGHAGAFTEWRRTCDLLGHHASIPEDAACWRGSGNYLYAPSSYFDGEDSRELLRRWINLGWDGSWAFVAFCELP